MSQMGWSMVLWANCGVQVLNYAINGGDFTAMTVGFTMGMATAHTIFLVIRRGRV